MSKQVFYPYASSTDVELTLRSIDPSIKGDPALHRLTLWAEPESQWLVEASVTLPADLDQLVPVKERDDPPVDVVLQIISVASRLREVRRLTVEDGRARLAMPLRFDDHRGGVEVSALVVRRTAASEYEEWLATHSGAVIAKSAVHKIEFDEPASRSADTLDVRWADFAESSDPWLQRHSGNLFALRTSASGAPPVVYLNRGVDRAGAVLDSNARTGHRARVRDGVFHLIVHQAWSSIVTASLTELKDVFIESPELPLDEALDALPAWMAAVVRDWSEWLIPDESVDEAMIEVGELVSGGQWEDLLVDRLPNAIAQRFTTADSFVKIAGELNL